MTELIAAWAVVVIYIATLEARHRKLKRELDRLRPMVEHDR